ncbi:hypothetical protein [Aeromicrobium erythreum]|uniref:Uncharacterized protein n=1 Tax=Aeromicrobium erythreum TaxID=2041 RepID=A0A0U4B6S3_9ACTN|nr:hypothetical protein [Aeromicrobium erythreum]ALX03737.1 hypothetical protein AERYTH_02985 [Aeromicrobium erythreum]
MRSFGTAVAELSSRVDSTDVHTVLAVAGLVPGIGEVADGADAALYLLEGDTKNALISFAAMVPGIGVGATLRKASVRLERDAAENLAEPVARRGPPTTVAHHPELNTGGVLKERSTGAAGVDMDSLLASGATVRHSATATAIGDDIPTLVNFGRSRGADGLHDVVVHGTMSGRPIVNGSVTHIQQIADAVLENPGYRRGCSIRLVMCHGGRESAAELARILGVDVVTTTRKAQLSPVTGRLLQGAFQ